MPRSTGWRWPAGARGARAARYPWNERDKVRILVTGGGGFLGRYIVSRLFDGGHQVAILGRSTHPDLEARGAEPFYGDLADRALVEAACRKREAVFHLAARAGVWGPRNAYFQANVTGTRNVIHGCRRHGVGYLVYTSTPSVVFDRRPFRDADETLPYGRRWLCHYAHTKAIAEREILAAHSGGDLRTLALRPHLIWGVGDPHLVPRVVDRARRGRLRVIGRGDNRVDITHVENAAAAHIDAFRALLADKGGGRAYFVSQGRPVVLWDWINDLLRRLDIPPVEDRIPLPVAYAVGWLLEGVYRLFRLPGEPPMTRFVAIQLAQDQFFSIDAARRDLGYRPRIETTAGLDELATHLRGNEAAGNRDA